MRSLGFLTASQYLLTFLGCEDQFKLLEDLLVYATDQWRALLPNHDECLALLDNTVPGAYETYPLDVPEWISE